MSESHSHSPSQRENEAGRESHEEETVSAIPDYGRDNGGVTRDELLQLIKRFNAYSYAYRADHFVCVMHYVDVFPHDEPMIRCHQFVTFTFISDGEDLTYPANKYRRENFPIYVDLFDEPVMYQQPGIPDESFLRTTLEEMSNFEEALKERSNKLLTSQFFKHLVGFLNLAYEENQVYYKMKTEKQRLQGALERVTHRLDKIKPPKKRRRKKARRYSVRK